MNKHRQQALDNLHKIRKCPLCNLFNLRKHKLNDVEMSYVLYYCKHCKTMVQKTLNKLEKQQFVLRLEIEGND